MQTIWRFLWPETVAGVSPIMKPIFILYYLATSLLVVSIWKQYVTRAYYTHWFDESSTGWLGRPEWEPDVRLLMTKDPLSHVRRIRIAPSYQIFRDALLICVGITLWVCGVYGLHILGENPTKEKTEVAAFVIGFLGFAGTATKAVYEWRLKVRSENRQKWINDIRDTLAPLIANLPSASDNEEALREKRTTYFNLHAKLELLMNPSENDHRVLMALIRHAYGFDAIPIDDLPRKLLKIADLQLSTQADRVELKSRIIRLSNVALKREWERVKHIQ